MLKFSSFQALTISGLNNVRMTNFSPSGRHHSRIKMYKIQFDWISHCGVMHWNAMENSSQPWPSFPRVSRGQMLAHWARRWIHRISDDSFYSPPLQIPSSMIWQWPVLYDDLWPLCRGHYPLNTVMRVAQWCIDAFWVFPHHVASVAPMDLILNTTD